MDEKIFIGIDPDVDKSGVAIWYKNQKKIELFNKSFFHLFDLLNFLKEQCPNSQITLIIEAGWLNKSNWHKGYMKDGKFVKNSEQTNENISKKTGANHEVGKKICEMAEYLKLNYTLIRPRTKKVNADMFGKITNVKTRTNQEQRDAAMLVFGL
jgi:hypothetical protein